VGPLPSRKFSLWFLWFQSVLASLFIPSPSTWRTDIFDNYNPLINGYSYLSIGHCEFAQLADTVGFHILFNVITFFLAFWISSKLPDAP
jgi:hypothetical protein